MVSDQKVLNRWQFKMDLGSGQRGSDQAWVQIGFGFNAKLVFDQALRTETDVGSERMSVLNGCG